MRPSFRLGFLSLLAALAACTNTTHQPVTADKGALPVMERITMGAQRCWYKTGDPLFAAYKLAPELNSYTGTPRILLVKKHAPETRPLLVVQATGNPAQLSAFGPLMGDAAFSARIHKDVNTWARGGTGC